MKSRNTERLIVGILWLLTAAALIAGRSGRFGDGWNRYAVMFSGIVTGWLVRSFLPVREETDPYKGLYAVIIPLLGLMVAFLAIALLAGSW